MNWELARAEYDARLAHDRAMAFCVGDANTGIPGRLTSSEFRRDRFTYNRQESEDGDTQQDRRA
jgi:hypothetical protein